MATKTQSALATVINSIFILSTTACSTLSSKNPNAYPFTVATPNHGTCIPVDLKDLAHRCLYDAAPQEGGELERRDLARQMVRRANPTNETPWWCLPPKTSSDRTAACAKAWRVPVLKTWQVPERDWSGADAEVNGESVGPPAPNPAESAEANAGCKGFMECQASFTAHHPIVAQSMTTVAIGVVGWALVRLIAGHGHRQDKPNGQTCKVASGDCPSTLPHPSCGDWLLMPPAQQALTAKPPGC